MWGNQTVYDVAGGAPLETKARVQIRGLERTLEVCMLRVWAASPKVAIGCTSVYCFDDG